MTPNVGVCKVDEMGTWGHQSFENDAALDWLVTLETRGIEAVRSTLKLAAMTKSAKPLDSDDGAAAVAAAEVVAAALSGDSSRVPRETRAWISENSKGLGVADARLALSAVERVLSKNSELAQLWDEASESEFRDVLRGLAGQLARFSFAGHKSLVPRSREASKPKGRSRVKQLSGRLPQGPRAVGRKALVAGWLVKIPLAGGAIAFGYWVEDSHLAVLDSKGQVLADPEKLLDVPPVTILFVSSRDTRSGVWERVLWRDPAMYRFRMAPCCRQSEFDLSLEIIDPENGDSRPGTYEECKDLELEVIYSPQGLIERLELQSKGLPLPERLRVVQPR